MAWAVTGSILQAADAATDDYYGQSVAISADGLVMAVGAVRWEGGTADQGGVYIYDWSGSSWTQRGVVRVAGDPAGSDLYGYGVSLSANGSILAVAARDWEGSSTNQGGVYVYDWSGSAWSQRGSVLVASDATFNDYYGSSVCISQSGLVLAVGAQGWEGTIGDQGAVYIYDWSGSVWTQRGSVLISPSPTNYGNYGSSVALSADAAILAVGEAGYGTSYYGGVHIYDWSGSAWVQRGSPLMAADVASDIFFGWSVSLSGSGDVLAVGAPYRPTSRTGGVYVYARAGSAWTQTGAVLGVPDAAYIDDVGSGVALDDTGTKMVVGVRGRTTYTGAVYTFTDTTPAGLGTLIMPLTIAVGEAGTLTAALTIKINPVGTLTAPLTIAVGEGGTITAPLTIAVRETGTISAPLTVRVYEIGTLTAALRFNVYNPTVFSATATLPAPVGAVPAWSVLVMLDDEDVSASLYGTVTVDAEEDASRVATFSLALSGAFNPTEKNRKPVTIDYRIGDTTWRIFTGRVDATVVDLQNRAIRFDCTDLRTDLLDGASPAQSDALTPTAYHSRVLYGKTPRGRDYLRQRLISYAGNMDLDAVGQLRVRSWSEGAVVKTHTDADVFDGSTSISISNATGAGDGRNEVIIETRTQRLRSAKCLINWYAADVDYYQPSPEIITEALDNLGEGWQAERSVISVDQNATDKTAIALSAELIRRWVQDVTTTRTYTLRAAGVAADAPIVSSNRVGIETRYVESAWVDDGIVEQDTEPGSDLEEEQQKSIKAALNATRKDILAAHRAHRVEYDIPLDPTIDLHNVYRLTTDSIDAAGQCARVQHIMDMDKGEVTTRISLALYGAGAEAPDVPDDSPLQPGIGDTSPVEVEIRIAAPAMNNQITVLPISGIGTTPNWSLSGWACEVHTRIAGTVVTEITEMDFDYGKLRDVSGKVLAYRSTTEYDYDIARSQFRIDIPAIDSDYIDEETGDYRENQTISIPASLLAITF